MSSAGLLQTFPAFDCISDPTSTAQRWEKWLKRFGNFIVTLNVTNGTRKRAMLLYYGGEDLSDIFETLPDHGDDDDYEKAVEALNMYFKPKKNVEYEVFQFRQASQNSSESLDSFYTRLRQLAATCDFHNMDREIKGQIILSCRSSRVRRKALRDADLTLKDILDFGRSMMTADLQAIWD